MATRNSKKAAAEQGALVARVNIEHDGQKYGPGDELPEMLESEEAQLVECGAAARTAPAAEEEPAAA